MGRGAEHMKRPQLSIVIPCYNEEACLHQLHARVKAVANQVAAGSHEIILVNDGSKDASWSIIQSLAEQDSALVAVDLSRNHGHQVALSAGLDLSCGDRILILDADLQDPPELLPEMLRMMDEQNADIVYGQRRNRQGDTLFKRWSAKVFYRLLYRLSDVSIPLDTGDFRLVSRKALNAFLALPENQRYLRGMFAWIGFKQVPLRFDRAERVAGETKYPLSKMLYLAINAMTSFSVEPLRVASHAGLLLTFVSMLCMVYAFYSWIAGMTVAGWASVIIVMAFLGGVQLLVLGMIGEYLGKLFVESKARPLYIVSEICGPRQGKPKLGYVPEDALIAPAKTSAAAKSFAVSERPMHG